MNITTLQEKLQKAKLIGAQQVALHHGTLEEHKSFGIIKLSGQLEAKFVEVHGEENVVGWTINEVITELQRFKAAYGDMEVKGSFESENTSFKVADPIKTVCVIAYKNSEKEDILMTLLSISDLT
ncbi:MAG: hypothetical protein Q8930_06400 [Bacillota bacterium]|nr:hypothetical protein [Bacillota bacterium]